MQPDKVLAQVVLEAHQRVELFVAKKTFVPAEIGMHIFSTSLNVCQKSIYRYKNVIFEI